MSITFSRDRVKYGERVAFVRYSAPAGARERAGDDDSVVLYAIGDDSGRDLERIFPGHFERGDDYPEGRVRLFQDHAQYEQAYARAISSYQRNNP